MKSAVLTALERIEIIERPVPEISKPDEVLIRMRSVGLCGSDVHYYRYGRIGSQVVTFPFTLGHEGAGVVEKTGGEVTSLKTGDRVAVDPAMPCGECDQCMADRKHTCRNLKFLGCPGQAEGCLSEYIVMPASSCYLIPKNITLDQAALSEPLSIGLYAVRSAGDIAGQSVGILGSGPIGVSVMLAARAMGSGKIYMSDRIDERLDLVRQMGADRAWNADICDIAEEILTAEPGQPGVVFECCGKQEAADQAIKILRPGGKLMVIGIPEFQRWSFDADTIRRKEISIMNVRRQNEAVSLTLEMISDGRIMPDMMQTHNFILDEISEAFEIVAGYKDGVMKAMIHI